MEEEDLQQLADTGWLDEDDRDDLDTMSSYEELLLTDGLDDFEEAFIRGYEAAA